MAVAEICKATGLEIERTDDYGIYFASGTKRELLESCLNSIVAGLAMELLSSNAEAEKALKFSECVPANLLKAEVVARRCTFEDFSRVLKEHYKFVCVQN
jgi:hypothetical protein